MIPACLVLVSEKKAWKTSTNFHFLQFVYLYFFDNTHNIQIYYLKKKSKKKKSNKVRIRVRVSHPLLSLSLTHFFFTLNSGGTSRSFLQTPFYAHSNTCGVQREGVKFSRILFSVIIVLVFFFFFIFTFFFFWCAYYTFYSLAHGLLRKTDALTFFF